MVALRNDMDIERVIAPDPNMPTRWGKQRVRYQFLRQLLIWVEKRRVDPEHPGIGTPSIRGFHQIIGGDKRISWSRFYRDHYTTLVDEGYISHDVDKATGATALVIHDKCKMLDL